MISGIDLFSEEPFTESEIVELRKLEFALKPTIMAMADDVKYTKENYGNTVDEVVKKVLTDITNLMQSLNHEKLPLEILQPFIFYIRIADAKVFDMSELNQDDVEFYDQYVRALVKELKKLL